MAGVREKLKYSDVPDGLQGLGFDQRTDNLRQMVESQKIEKALAEYVEGLKEQFFIDEKS